MPDYNITIHPLSERPEGGRGKGQWGKWQRFFSNLSSDEMGVIEGLTQKEAHSLQVSIFGCFRKKRGEPFNFKVKVAMRKERDGNSTVYLWKEQKAELSESKLLIGDNAMNASISPISLWNKQR